MAKKKHKKVLAYIIGTIIFIASIVFVSSFLTELYKNWGTAKVLIISGAILLAAIILGYMQFKDLPILKKMGSK